MSTLALWSAQPSSQWLVGALSVGLKWTAHEADHLPPPNAGVKKGAAHTSSWHGV